MNKWQDVFLKARCNDPTQLLIDGADSFAQRAGFPKDQRSWSRVVGYVEQVKPCDQLMHTSSRTDPFLSIRCQVHLTQWHSDAASSFWQCGMMGLDKSHCFFGLTKVLHIAADAQAVAMELADLVKYSRYAPRDSCISHGGSQTFRQNFLYLSGCHIPP